MIFSLTFEIGLLILGLLYIGDLYFDSVIDLIRIGHEIEEQEKNSSNDAEVSEIVKHMYS